jgi:hypothetical protein
MSLADELQKLEALRKGGTLTEVEFQQAKALLLNGGVPSTGHPLADQLEELRDQNELARIDREWQMEREQYLMSNRYGRRIVPTSGLGLASAIGGGVFGLFWLIMAVTITGSAPDDGPFVIAKFVFPLFGVVFILVAVGWGLVCLDRARKYEEAHKAYEARRRAAGG